MSITKKPTRILVIRAGQLGDTVFASSIIKPLLNHFGESTVIDWVAKAGMGKVPKEADYASIKNWKPEVGSATIEEAPKA